MNQKEQEARLLAVADLTAINKRLVAEVCSISALVARLLGGEPTGRVIGTLRKLQTEGRSFGPEAAVFIERLDEFYATPRARAHAARMGHADCHGFELHAGTRLVYMQAVRR